jgi:hypothetical protein
MGVPRFQQVFNELALLKEPADDCLALLGLHRVSSFRVVVIALQP